MEGLLGEKGDGEGRRRTGVSRGLNKKTGTRWCIVLSETLIKHHGHGPVKIPMCVVDKNEES